MGNLVQALLIVIVINGLMVLADMSMKHLYEGENPPNMYNCEGSILSKFTSDCSSDVSVINNSNIPALMPGSSEATSPTTGNIFTDVFTSIKNWFLDLPGINYVYAILSSPYNIIKAIGMPNEVTVIISAMWYGISLFLLIAFLWWRD